MNAVLAFALSSRGWELAGLFSGLITLAGVWLRWRSPWHYSDIEEDLKNDKISPDQAQRRMRSIERRATVLTFGGLGLLTAVVAALLW